MASLVDQIFRQIEGGSAQGEGFGDAYFRGKQLSQDQQRINLSERQLAAELAQLPLKMTLDQQEAKKQELEIQGMLQSRQNYLDSTQAFTSLSARVEEQLRSGELEEAVRELAIGGLNNNTLLNDPRYKALSTQLSAMQREADRAAYQKSIAEARMKTAEAAETRAEAAQSGQDLAKTRTELGIRNAELREKELQHRITEAQKKLDPVRRIEMQAKLKAIEDDLTLLSNREKKNQLIEEVMRQYGVTAAPPAAPDAPRAAPKLRWTPNGFVPVE